MARRTSSSFSSTAWASGPRARSADRCAATGNELTGTLSWVRIQLGDDDHSHLIDPEHRLAVAMMKQ
jgi:hypothetical protein